MVEELLDEACHFQPILRYSRLAAACVGAATLKKIAAATTKGTVRRLICIVVSPYVMTEMKLT